MVPLLAVEGLAKSFGATKAVKGLDFTVMEGRCAALLGPNGAGKTTTIRMLTGLLKATEGKVRINGGSGRERQDIRELLGYVPQSPSFYGWMTGKEYVVYAGKLCGLTARQADVRAQELLSRVGLEEAGKRRIQGYSGGMKQRLGLAQSLVHRPKLLVMDEPVSALDPIGRREVLELLQELKSETTVLFSTHVLHDAEELCDDIIIMASGQIALQGSLQEVRNNNRLPVINIRLEEGHESREWAMSLKRDVELLASKASDMESGSRRLALLRHVREAEQEGCQLRLMVDDISQARQMLLEELADGKVGVTKLEIGSSSLEDLFMKVVKG
ncbi:ABC transporter ATP-binding protein [Paenibacillus sp. CAU 1782]